MTDQNASLLLDLLQLIVELADAKADQTELRDHIDIVRKRIIAESRYTSPSA